MDEVEPLDRRPTDAVPAASLILVRDRPEGLETLMIERAAKLVFAGGAMAFPGGRVEPSDHAAAVALGATDDVEACAARVAAVRETLEEVGVWAGGAQPAPDALKALRQSLSDGVDIVALIRAAGAELDVSTLHPFVRWCPHRSRVRTFDTRFFVAVAWDGANAVADGTESVHAHWVRPADALAAEREGRATMLFPTRRHLERLAGFADSVTLLADCAERAESFIIPWLEDRDGVPHLCIPEGIGYPVTSEIAPDFVRAQRAASAR